MNNVQQSMILVRNPSNPLIGSVNSFTDTISVMICHYRYWDTIRASVSEAQILTFIQAIFKMSFRSVLRQTLRFFGTLPYNILKIPHFGGDAKRFRTACDFFKEITQYEASNCFKINLLYVEPTSDHGSDMSWN